MAEQARTISVVGRLRGEPTFHFVLLAAVLFVANSLFRSGNAEVIEIDQGWIEARVLQIELARGAPLSAEEKRQVRETYIEERVLVREARAMGLEDDERIHYILVQKMLHVLSADVIQPTDAELTAYYDANRMRYAPLPAVTVDEIVVPMADRLPGPLEQQLRKGTAPEQLAGDLSLSHKVLPQMTLDELTRIFGSATAELIFGAELGIWVGPHRTVRGEHWFRLTERAALVPPPLEVVREQVRLDWIGAKEAARLEQRVNELRGRYSIVLTGEGFGP